MRISKFQAFAVALLASGWLIAPAHAATVIKAMTQAVKIPVTVKMRAGWNDGERNAQTLARMVESGIEIIASTPSIVLAIFGLIVFFGGYGFMDEYPVSRYWRNVKAHEIGEGTSEVQRMLIARELGLVG